MQWKSIYATNNSIIDAQHKELVRIVNELENCLARGDKELSRNISSVLTCIKYCIEIKQNYFSEFSEGASKQQAKYYESALNELLTFFSSAKVGDDKKVAFIMQWLKEHLISEKERLEKLSIPKDAIPCNKLDEDSKTRQAIDTKYEKLKSLFTQKLINSDDFKENKTKIFVDFLFSQGLQNFDLAYDELNDLMKSSIISENERAEYLAIFLKKTGVEDAMKHIKKVEGRLRYLTTLYEQRLISEDKFINFKNSILEEHLDLKPHIEKEVKKSESKL